MAVPSAVGAVRWNLTFPQAPGPHAYFNQWAADPRCILSVALRSQLDLDQYAEGLPTAPCWVYDDLMDAAKGTVVAANPQDGDIRPQLRINHPTTTGQLTFVWDLRIDSAWANEPGKVPPKAFQLPKPGNALYIETRLDNRASGSTVDWRVYGTLGPGASRNKDPNGISSDTVQPLLSHYQVAYDRWTRFVQHIDIGALDADGIFFNLCSLWVMDEMRDAIQLYDRVAISLQTSLPGFWFEYDASQPRSAGALPKSIWNRNFLMFHGMTDPSVLFIRPS